VKAALAFAWREFKLWDEAAISRKQTWTKVKAALPLAGFIGLLIGLAATYVPPAHAGLSKGLYLASAALVALVAYGAKLLGPDRDQPWLKARAVAEGIKGEIFRFVTRVEKYPPEQLADRVEALRKQADFPSSRPLEDAPPPADLPPYPLDPATYLQKRVLDQRDYFARRCAENLAQARKGTVFGHAFGGLLVVAGVVTTVFPDVLGLEGWSTVLSGAAAMLASQLYSGRYEFEARLYDTARFQLDSTEMKLRIALDENDPAKLTQLISQAEDVLRNVNNAWFSEWTKQEQPGQAQKA
jgi:hypothetical protein